MLKFQLWLITWSVFVIIPPCVWKKWLLDISSNYSHISSLLIMLFKSPISIPIFHVTVTISFLWDMCQYLSLWLLICSHWICNSFFFMYILKLCFGYIKAYNYLLFLVDWNFYQNERVVDKFNVLLVIILIYFLNHF